MNTKRLVAVEERVGKYVWIGLVAVGMLYLGDVARLLGYSLGGVGQHVPEVSTVPVPVGGHVEIVTAWDVIRSLISLFALAALAWTMFRSRTASVYKDELEAQRARAERLATDVRDHDRALQDLNVQLVAERAKTDITQVLRVQGELLEMKRQHDTAMLTSLHSLAESVSTAVAQGDVRYADILERLSATAGAAATQTAANAKTLARLVEMAGELTKRVGNVERAVDADAPEPRPEPARPERRRTPREDKR
jgi:hypothetical protein